jgi:hypothetical protein
MSENYDVLSALLKDPVSALTAVASADVGLATSASVTAATAGKAPLASPVFTGLPQLPSYAKASLPSATAVGQVIFVSDATGGTKTGSVAFAIATGTGSWVDVTTGTFVA